MDNYLSNNYSNESTLSYENQDRREKILQAFQLYNFTTNPDTARMIIKKYNGRNELSLINTLCANEFNEAKIELHGWIKNWNRYDTYFKRT